MPTIKDIAVRAGVSHGTVSNVLNKKGNVSVEKINLVEKAARELGFKLNAQAKQLRQGHADRVCIVVPRLQTKRYGDLVAGIGDPLKEEGYDIDVFYSSNLAHDEKEIIERVSSSHPSAVVVVSCFLRNPGVFGTDARTIFVERKVKNMPDDALFVSFDFKKAGGDMARRCAQDGHRNIALFCESEKYSNHKDFARGAAEMLESLDCDWKMFHAVDTMGLYGAFELAASLRHYDFDAVVTDSLENARCLMEAYKYRKGPKLPIYSLSSKSILPEEGIIRYELNYKLCGRKIAKYIMKSNSGEAPPRDYLAMENDGFSPGLVPGFFPVQDERINVLILSSPTSKALRYLMPSFTKKTGIQVKLVEVSYDELYKSASDSMESRAYDLIRLDMVWLSRLGEKLFMPLDLETEPLRSIKDSISPGLPADYYQVGGKAYSLPFDPSVQILYYRKDLFEDALLKRKFYEKYRRQLTVPRTFEEYNQVAEFFTRKYNPDSPTRHGASLVFGSAVVAACDYLPRLKALGAEFFHPSGRVCLDKGLMKKALENYLATYQYTDQSAKLWWQAAAVAFAEGNVAMNIVFANHASVMVQSPDSKVVGKVGFAAVPGGCPLLGGGVMGITKSSKKRDASMAFLQWIYSEKVASAITYLGGYINHAKLLDNVDVLELYPWIEGMEKAFAIGWRRENDQGSFDEFKFEEILGVTVRSAVSGVLTVDQAIEEAQLRCDEAFMG